MSPKFHAIKVVKGNAELWRNPSVEGNRERRSENNVRLEFLGPFSATGQEAN
jgi:hypothetical protein